MFELLQELDSIVMFEGELTLAEVLENIDHPSKWYDIQGFAFRNESGIIINKPRPLIQDLDSLPYVFRDSSFEKIVGIKTAHLLASRGCLHNCSFCSIRQFYGNFKGPLRRTRSPKSVVEEMYLLFVQDDIRFFSFQDDDFAYLSPSQKKWIHSFLDELRRKNLGGKIKWKISCRADDFDLDTLVRMKEQGLSAVYLGIESGNISGLKTLNKGTTIEQNLNAVKQIKLAGLYISIGFMLFDPSSTFDSVRENLNFLRTISSDGYFPINFCKMLPYAGTPIEKLLKNTNRLKGTAIQSDYDFLDPLLNIYFYFVQKMITQRNFNESGLFALMQDADFGSYLMCLLNPDKKNISYREKVTGLIARANIQVIDTLERLMDFILSKNIEEIVNNSDEITAIAEEEWRTENEIEIGLIELQRSNPF